MLKLRPLVGQLLMNYGIERPRVSSPTEGHRARVGRQMKGLCARVTLGLTLLCGFHGLDPRTWMVVRPDDWLLESLFINSASGALEQLVIHSTLLQCLNRCVHSFSLFHTSLTLLPPSPASCDSQNTAAHLRIRTRTCKQVKSHLHQVNINHPSPIIAETDFSNLR